MSDERGENEDGSVQVNDHSQDPGIVEIGKERFVCNCCGKRLLAFIHSAMHLKKT